MMASNSYFTYAHPSAYPFPTALSLGPIGYPIMPISTGNRSEEPAPRQGVEPPLVFLSDATLCPIVSLPHELVLEVASWTDHPADILSLALTNRYFRSILLGAQSHGTWRHARERMELITSLKIDGASTNSRRISIIRAPAPIPKPYEGMSEDELARILWGPKICTSCRKMFNGTPRVLGLNGFWCKHCFSESAFTTTAQALEDFNRDGGNGINDFSQLWRSLPRVYEGILGPSYRGDFASQRAWTKIKEKWQNMPKDPVVKQCLALHPLMDSRKEHSKILNTWLERYNNHLRQVEATFKTSAEIWASSHQLNPQDLLKAPRYRHLEAIAKRERTLFLERLLTPEISNELVQQTFKITTNRVGRTTAKATDTRRADILTLYHSHNFADAIKPPLPLFRKLPVIQALQNSYSYSKDEKMKEYRKNYYYSGSPDVVSDKISIADALKGRGYLDLMEVGVEKWKVEAVRGARKMLGYVQEESRSARKRKRKDKDKRKGNYKKRKYENLIIPLGMDVDALQTDTNSDSDTDGDEGDEEMDVDAKLIATSSKGPQERPSTLGNVQDHDAIPLDQPQAVKKWIPTPGKRDPEMRITSWFTCTKCHKFEPAYKRLKVFDFRGLCAHSCVQVDKKKRDRTKWSINNFALAPRAIETTRKMLDILVLDDADIGTTRKSLEVLWVCNNCPPTVRALYWEDLIRHCLRHPSQDISMISEEAAAQRALPDARKSPYTFADLLTGKHKNEVMTEQFACVHCHPSILSRNLGEPEGDVVAGDEMKKRKTMKFHGMRQHMKAKHEIEDVRNEDFYFLAEGLFKPLPEDEKTTEDLRGKPDTVDQKGKGKATTKAGVLRDRGCCGQNFTQQEYSAHRRERHSMGILYDMRPGREVQIDI